MVLKTSMSVKRSVALLPNFLMASFAPLFLSRPRDIYSTLSET